MLKLLTPISHLFKESEEARDDIISYSDNLEARERTSSFRLPNTTHYHIDFDLNIGITEVQKHFLRTNVRGRDYITTLTFQAARDCANVELKNKMYVPCSPPIALKEQIENTIKSLREIKDIVGSDRAIGIENNNYYPTGAYDISTSLTYLLEVLSVTDLHLLLDVAHAKVSAFNLNIELDEYIRPLLETGLCKQVHICEPGIIVDNAGKDLMVDLHEIPSQELTEYTLNLMSKFNIEYLTCEYYKEKNKLVSYLEYVRKLDSSKWLAL